MADKKISDLTPAGAITGSELVELVQGGASVRSTVNGIKNGAVKAYRALLTQSGTSAPTAIVLENSLGGTVVWSRTSLGEYVGTLAAAFIADKTFVLIGTPPQSGFGASPSPAFAFRGDGNTVLVKSISEDLTAPGGNYADDILISTALEILVYP